MLWCAQPGSAGRASGRRGAGQAACCGCACRPRCRRRLCAAQLVRPVAGRSAAGGPPQGPACASGRGGSSSLRKFWRSSCISTWHSCTPGLPGHGHACSWTWELRCAAGAGGAGAMTACTAELQEHAATGCSQGNGCPRWAVHLHRLHPMPCVPAWQQVRAAQAPSWSA